jgi:hypothetical protein
VSAYVILMNCKTKHSRTPWKCRRGKKTPKSVGVKKVISLKEVCMNCWLIERDLTPCLCYSIRFKVCFFFFFSFLSWVADWKFSAPVQTGPGAHPASCTMVTASLSQGVKRPRRGVDHPPTFSTEVNENSSPTHLTPLWPFTACSRLTFASNLNSSRGFYTA